MLDPFHENVARDVELSYHVTEEDNSHPAMRLTNMIRTNNNTILITNTSSKTLSTIFLATS